VAERTVRTLQGVSEVELRLYPAVSFLDALFISLGIDPVEGLTVLDGNEVAYLGTERLEPRTGTVICQVDSRDLASDVKLTLLEVYPPEFPVKVLDALGTGGERIWEIPLQELDRKDLFHHLTTLYLPPLQEEDIFDFKRLMALVARLRGPDGCPWDRKQTHQTLARHLIEESHEAIEAIRKKDWDHLAEELGDILLQVALHAQLASEEGHFVVSDSLRLISEKLVRRHPHVFGDVKLHTPEEVIARWERIKLEEEERGFLLEGVTADLPALLFAYKIQTKAARVGFDWDFALDVFSKLEEELEEIQEMIRNNGEDLEGELGDLLFSIVNLCRHLKVDPEMALYRSALKFKRRFRYMEEICRREGLRVENLTLDELDRLWDESKLDEQGE
jgi:tetrapyrrole methylase family protein/MazG family protein